MAGWVYGRMTDGQIDGQMNEEPNKWGACT